MKIYTVRRGESISSIAQRCGYSGEEIIRFNRLSNPSALAVGQVLMLPAPPSPGRRIIVNGYLSRCTAETAAEALPCLSFLSPFSFRCDALGALHDGCACPAFSPESSATRLLTITNQAADGTFSPHIAHAVCCDKKVQYRFFQNVAALLAQAQYYGVNLNFTYLHAFEREAYTRFFARFSEFLHSHGALIVTALPPQSEDSLTEPHSAAFDYRAIGESADYVILLSYDWAHRGTPPGAIAPLGKMRTLLSYAAARIPPEKILLSVPNYALDWTLPFHPSRSARPLSCVQATELAAAVGAEIRFSESARCPTFDFYDSTGKHHRVWLEDARSLSEKYALIDAFRLAGVSFWNLDHDYAPVFPALQQHFYVEKLR